MANSTYTYTNVTVPSSISIANGAGGYTLTTNGTGGHAWTTSAATGAYTIGPSVNPKVKITETDIEIDGMSLRATMLAIQDRLAILVPDPKKLKEFTALKEAYDHYKTLEALCCSTENTDKK